MFQGVFSGLAGKGSYIFWGKEQGSINAAGYRDRVIPLVDGQIRPIEEDSSIRHEFMQDNAPAHTAAATVTEFEERGIKIILWPPNSLDFNLIKYIQRQMKEWI